MHLYKPACADIPPHKPSLQKPSEALLKGKKPSVVPKICPPLCGWAGKASGAAELKQLEKFLHVHGLSLQDTVRAETGMKYRYRGCRGAAWGGRPNLQDALPGGCLAASWSLCAPPGRLLKPSGAGCLRGFSQLAEHHKILARPRAVVNAEELYS